jgi:hypothetical protein
MAPKRKPPRGHGGFQTGDQRLGESWGLGIADRISYKTARPKKVRAHFNESGCGLKAQLTGVAA